MVSLRSVNFTALSLAMLPCSVRLHLASSHTAVVRLWHPIDVRDLHYIKIWLIFIFFGQHIVFQIVNAYDIILMKPVKANYTEVRVTHEDHSRFSCTAPHRLPV